MAAWTLLSTGLQMALITIITLWYHIVSRSVFAAVFDYYGVSWSGKLWPLCPLLGEFLFVYLLVTNWLESDSRG